MQWVKDVKNWIWMWTLKCLISSSWRFDQIGQFNHLGVNPNAQSNSGLNDWINAVSKRRKEVNLNPLNEQVKGNGSQVAMNLNAEG